MSLNLPNVKDIVRDGKHVKNIMDSNGNIIWGGVEYKDVPYQRTITVGSGQDITTTQYANRIVVPSINTIKNKLATLDGVPSSSVTVTDVELVNSTIHWVTNSTSTYYGFMSTTSGTSGTLINPSNAATWSSGSTGIYTWRAGVYFSVFEYLLTSNTKPFYGLYSSSSSGAVPSTFGSSISSTSTRHFCNSSSTTTLPTYSIRVSYTVNELVEAYPYRKLDSIYFSGGEYIQLPYSYTSGTINAMFNLDSIDSGYECCIGAYRQNYSDRTWEIDVLSNRLYFNNINVYSNLQVNTWYRVVCTVANSTTNAAYTITLYNSSGTQLATKSGNLTNTASINFTNLIGCRLEEGTTRGRYYSGYLGDTELDSNESSNIDYNLVPCQRKSDSVCGMYDKISSTFLPLNGTVITDGARGTIIDEYWDLT